LWQIVPTQVVTYKQSRALGNGIDPSHDIIGIKTTSREADDRVAVGASRADLEDPVAVSGVCLDVHRERRPARVDSPGNESASPRRIHRRN
jgi:hypothetical protein